MHNMQGLDLSDRQGLERRVWQVEVRVALSDERAVQSVVDHLAGLRGTPLKVPAGGQGGLGASGEGVSLTVTWLSDGIKTVKDWRHLVNLLMSAMLATLPCPSQKPPLAVPIHRLVSRCLTCDGMT